MIGIAAFNDFIDTLQTPLGFGEPVRFLPGFGNNLKVEIVLIAVILESALEIQEWFDLILYVFDIFGVTPLVDI